MPHLTASSPAPTRAPRERFDARTRYVRTFRRGAYGRGVADFAALATARATSFGLQIAATAFIARGLGPTAFGELALGRTIWQGFSSAINGTYDTAVIKTVAAAPESAIAAARYATRRKLILGLLSVPLGVALAYALGGPVVAIIALAAAGILIGPSASADSSLRGMQRFGRSGVVMITEAAAVVTGAALLWHFHGRSVHAGIVVSIGPLAAAAISILLLRQVAERSSRSKVHLSRGLLVPLLVYQVAVLVYNSVDVLTLGAFHQYHQAGLYAVVVRLVWIGITLQALLGQLALPKIQRLHSIGAYPVATALRATALLSLAGFAVWGAYALFAARLLVLLYGPQYASAGSILALRSLALPFLFAQTIPASYLLAIGRARLLAIASVIAAVVNVSINLLFVGRFGAMACAVASVSTEAICAGIVLGFLLRHASRTTAPRPAALAGA